MEKGLNGNKFVKFYEKAGIAVILVAEIIIFSLLSDTFFSVSNLLLVGRQVSFVGIAAVGVTMVLLVGEIDISVGSILAFTGCLGAILMVNYNMPILLALIITLAVSLLFGLASGAMTAYWKIPSLICTLAMQTIIKGITYLMTGGIPVSGVSDEFKYLGQGFVFDTIPVPLIFMIVMFVIGFIVLNKTYIGRRIYAVGGNEEAARLSGIKNKKIVMGTFMVSAVMAGFAGFLMAARLGTGQPSTGGDFAMDVLTATVLGGVMLTGGKGHIQNVFVGAFIIGILSNGLIMCGVLEYWQWVVKGLVFLFAVAMSNLETFTSKK